MQTYLPKSIRGTLGETRNDLCFKKTLKERTEEGKGELKPSATSLRFMRCTSGNNDLSVTKISSDTNRYKRKQPKIRKPLHVTINVRAELSLRNMQIDQITRAADNSVFRQEFRIIQSETRKKNVCMLWYSSEYFPILAQLFVLLCSVVQVTNLCIVLG